MEHLEYEFSSKGGTAVTGKKFCIVGVVASGNLEVLMEYCPTDGKCTFSIDTAASGFSASWQAVISDFMERCRPASLRVSINDNAASPALVSLRLDQAYETLTGDQT